MTIDRLRAAEDVLRAAKFLYSRGMVNAFEGNVSRRFGGSLLITPSQVCKEELTPLDLVEVDIATGETLYSAPGRRASSEVKLHLCCYRTRADVEGIAHAHPPYATAFAVCGRPIETAAYPEMILLHGRVPICRYGRPSTDSVNDEVPAALAEYDSFLIENHGLVSVDISAMAAAYRLEAIESIAGVLTKARALGGEKPLPPGEAEALEAQRRAARSL